jgi:hypothetical protein
LRKVADWPSQLNIRDSAGQSQGNAHEVDAAALPAGLSTLATAALIPSCASEIDAPQAAAGELPQEGGPEGLGFGRADLEPSTSR